jgi:uncharacterized delta-60 repeat protein
MGKLLFFFSWFMLCITLANAQVDTAWVRRYDGPVSGTDQAFALFVDTDENVYVTGRSADSGIVNYDCLTIKYDTGGNELWTARYHHGVFDVARDVVVDHLGNVYITGYSWQTGTGNEDYITIKYDADGNQVWAQGYNGSGNDTTDIAQKLTIDLAGNVYVTGFSVNAGTSYDYATIKYNTDGETQWVRSYNGPANGDDRAYDLAVDGSGNVIVSGGCLGTGTGWDMTTIKYNTDGDILWIRQYNGPDSGNDYTRDLEIDSAGNIYITGYSYEDIGVASWDYATIKYDKDGNERWVARYDPIDAYDYANALAVDNKGNVYVTGWSYVGFINDMDYCTVKYDSSGNEIWAKNFNGPSSYEDEATDIAVDNSGNCYVTGRTWGFGTQNYTTVKYDTLGNILWVASYDNGREDVARAIKVSPSENIYITGWSEGAGTNYDDFATIKLFPAGVGTAEEILTWQIKNQENILSWHFGSQKLDVFLQSPGYVKISVLNLLGQKIRNLYNGFLTKGLHSVIFDGNDNNGSKLVNGVYFVRLECSNYKEIEKVILLE